jgi:plasmid stability protein
MTWVRIHEETKAKETSASRLSDISHVFGVANIFTFWIDISRNRVRRCPLGNDSSDLAIWTIANFIENSLEFFSRNFQLNRVRDGSIMNPIWIHRRAGEMSVNLSIKNVPDGVAEALRRRAARNRRSLQGELLVILEEGVLRDGVLSPSDLLREIRSAGLRTPSESARMIREERDAHAGR